jgi:dynein heavy chain
MICLDSGDAKRDHRPFFKCNAVLAIPNIVMQPALDEVQQVVNKAAQAVLNVFKGISQWEKDPRFITQSQKVRSLKCL